MHAHDTDGCSHKVTPCSHMVTHGNMQMAMLHVDVDKLALCMHIAFKEAIQTCMFTQ